MFIQYGTEAKEKQTAEEESQWWAEQLESYLPRTASGWMPIWIDEWSGI